MNNHMAVRGACQPPGDGAIPPTTAPRADHRLVARYGAAALDAGYAAIPHVVIRQRRALTITPAEWDYICEVWSYWRSDALPGPSVEDLAQGLSVDQSTIRRHRASLERKGLLRVVPAGPYNRYDLRPLIDAAVGLDRMGNNLADDSASGTTPTPTPGPCNSPINDRAELHATKELEKKLDNDSIPPYPPMRKKSRANDDTRPVLVPDDQAVVAAISALSAKLGDDAPASSIARVSALWGATGMPRDRFLALIDEAAARTRGRHDRIIARGRDGGPSGMRYFLAVLADLLRPAPPLMCGASIIPDRRHIDRPRRQRRRDEATDGPCGEDTYDPHPEPPAAEMRPEWRDTLNELRGELTGENYRRWFAPTRVLGLEGDLLRVEVPDSFHHQWLDRRLRGAVERAMARAAPRIRVVFEVASAV